MLRKDYFSDFLKNRVIVYTIFFVVTLLLISLRNPVPFIRGDLWGEDARFYIADTINQGFWKAFYTNLWYKGYAQIGKFILAKVGLIIVDIFDISIVYLPQVISIVSYCLYASVFCLPILLFSKFVKYRYLIAIALANCFVILGDLDNFLVFGRILNISFLLIYFCFLLVIYRLLLDKSLNGILLYIIDFSILVCVLTQPINILLLLLVYLYYLFDLVACLLKRNRNVFYKKATLFLRHSPSLLIIGAITFSYILFLIFSDLGDQSYATTYGSGHSQYGRYAHKFYLGKFWFNQIAYPVYERLPEFVFVLGAIILFILVFVLRKRILFYSLYCLIIVSAMTIYWRPGLLVVMRYNDHLKATIYTMSSNLIFIFMSFFILAYVMEKISKFNNSYIKLENIFLFTLLSIYLATGIDSILEAEFRTTIPFRDALCIAEKSNAITESGLVKVPANPNKNYMLLPESLVECKISS